MMTKEEAQQELQHHRFNTLFQVANIVEKYTPFNTVELTISYLKAGVFEELLE